MESLKSKKLKRKVVSVILVGLMILAAIALPMAVQAATPKASTTKTTSAPYQDVTVKKVGQSTFDAVSYIKAHKGYKSLFTGTKFYPNKQVTRRQFIIILKNLYGNNKVPVTLSDMLNMNKPISAKYACDKTKAVAAKFGVKMRWSNIPKATLTRGSASLYIKIFKDFTKLKPKQ